MAGAGGLEILFQYVRFVFFAINIFVVSALHTLIMLLIYPIKYILPQLYVTLESFLNAKCGEAFIPAWIVCPKLRVYTDSLSVVEPITRCRAMVLANHQDSGDVPIMMSLLAYFNISHTTTWIVDKMFRWTPFGIPAQWHNDFYSEEGTREKIIEQIKEHFTTTYFKQGRKWLIFFPEGGYLKNRGERARNWAKDQNLPVLYNCVLPRTTAFTSVVQAFRGEVRPVPERVEDILDVTIMYTGPGDLCLTDIARGNFREKEVYINFRSYKIEDLPRDEEGLKKWLYDRYEEKEAMIQRFKDHGEFVEGGSFTQLHQNPGRLGGSLVFWYIGAFFIVDLYKSFFTRILSLGDMLYS